MRKESFLAAFDLISLFFSNVESNIAYTTRDLTLIFNSYREVWKIANYRNSKDFISFLISKNILSKITLKHKVSGSLKTILTKELNYNHIALTIKKSGYISYYSAMSRHNLTLQIPKNIYVSYSKEKPYKYVKNELIQDAIDRAFSKPQRISSDIYVSEKDNFKITLVQKAYEENPIGVICEDGIFYSDLERTILDIVVRPVYSGGVFEVLEAFERAKGRLDVLKLYNYYKALDFIYPYHQLIGFYMSRSEYSSDQIDIFIKESVNYKFYLTYNISNKEFDSNWNIYYPKGF